MIQLPKLKLNNLADMKKARRKNNASFKAKVAIEAMTQKDRIPVSNVFLK